MDYVTVKWLHILSSTLLFGTGIGSAFYLLFATLTREVRAIAAVTRYVVVADWLFTATSAVFQPLSGVWLVHLMGLPLSTPWIATSLWLYAFAIACWLPVVWIQVRLRDLGSTNGTLLNGQRLALQEEAVLRPGDRMRVGATIAVYEPPPVSIVDEPSGVVAPEPEHVPIEEVLPHVGAAAAMYSAGTALLGLVRGAGRDVGGRLAARAGHGGGHQKTFPSSQGSMMM